MIGICWTMEVKICEDHLATYIGSKDASGVANVLDILHLILLVNIEIDVI